MLQLLQALDELADLDSDELLEEIMPELGELCRHVWLLELLIAYCHSRKH